MSQVGPGQGDHVICQVSWHDHVDDKWHVIWHDIRPCPLFMSIDMKLTWFHVSTSTCDMSKEGHVSLSWSYMIGSWIIMMMSIDMSHVRITFLLKDLTSTYHRYRQLWCQIITCRCRIVDVKRGHGRWFIIDVDILTSSCRCSTIYRLVDIIDQELFRWSFHRFLDDKHQSNSFKNFFIKLL